MPTTNLTMTVRKRDEGVSVIDIVGEITSFADADITAAHEKASAESPKAVVLNFTGLDYMNSGGIGLLVTTLIRAQRSGHQLLAYGLTEHYAQIFALTRLNEAIGIFEDEESAVASVA
jgi:anti-sigma B factor antagonist